MKTEKKKILCNVIFFFFFFKIFHRRQGLKMVEAGSSSSKLTNFSLQEVLARLTSSPKFSGSFKKSAFKTLITDKFQINPFTFSPIVISHDILQYSQRKNKLYCLTKVLVVVLHFIFKSKYVRLAIQQKYSFPNWRYCFKGNMQNYMNNSSIRKNQCPYQIR